MTARAVSAREEGDAAGVQDIREARERRRHGVGIIIGGACGKIVSSLVNDVVMPPIGFATGRVSFEKECHYCLSVVPLGATRCAHCTSVPQPA